MVQEQHAGVSFQEGEEMVCGRYDQDTAYMHEIVKKRGQGEGYNFPSDQVTSSIDVDLES